MRIEVEFNPNGPKNKRELVVVGLEGLRRSFEPTEIDMGNFASISMRVNMRVTNLGEDGFLLVTDEEVRHRVGPSEAYSTKMPMIRKYVHRGYEYVHGADGVSLAVVQTVEDGNK